MFARRRFLLRDGVADAVDDGKEEGEVDAAGDDRLVCEIELREAREQSAEVHCREWEGVDQRGLNGHDSSGPEGGGGGELSHKLTRCRMGAEGWE